jgi:hypothetical protein
MAASTVVPSLTFTGWPLMVTKKNWLGGVSTDAYALSAARKAQRRRMEAAKVIQDEFNLPAPCMNFSTNLQSKANGSAQCRKILLNATNSASQYEF